MAVMPETSPDAIAALSRQHLEAVVAIESSSDETSTSVPSTEGQRRLSEYLEGFFRDAGCEVTLDEHANVIARLAGRGERADASPLALMIHLDTARGTEARSGLELLCDWDGSRVPYPDNDRLQVSVKNYRSLQRYVGHDLLYGSGKAPFGLDDKLGLSHMMTVAKLLHQNPEIPHRPLLFIGRPDEEIGREDALLGLAKWLGEQGVDSGYTVDGIDPFEVNVENFNAMGVSLRLGDRAVPDAIGEGGERIAVTLLGVNTHGATAKAEGHRGALRLAAQVAGELAEDQAAVSVLDFQSDPVRDCDGVLRLWVADAEARKAVDGMLETIVGPHVPRGAGWSVASDTTDIDAAHIGAARDALSFMRSFMASRTGEPLMCEDSDGFAGYTYPYRARRVGGRLQIDVRIRDFDPQALDARQAHVGAVARAHLADVEVDAVPQYTNMGPRLAARSDLLEQAIAAAEEVGVQAERRPIRGGTGVDPFLDAGVFVANLGTGYFAPESEKELTSMQLLADHARWLLALVQR